MLELNLSVGISWFSKEWNKFLSCLEQSLSLEYFFSKHKNLLSSPVARNTYQSHIWSILWNTHICCLHECWALSSLVDFSWETCHTLMTESTYTHLKMLLLHWGYTTTCSFFHSKCLLHGKMFVSYRDLSKGAWLYRKRERASALDVKKRKKEKEKMR